MWDTNANFLILFLGENTLDQLRDIGKIKPSQWPYVFSFTNAVRIHFR